MVTGSKMAGMMGKMKNMPGMPKMPKLQFKKNNIIKPTFKTL